MTIIRMATKADVPQIYSFVRALAEYERVAPEAVFSTEAILERDGFGENPFFHCLLAEQDGRPAGFAIYLFSYSTFEGRPGLYVEDLYVVPELRGLGIGKALLAQAAAVAVGMGCKRMQWEVLDWNLPAIEFYGTLGASFVDVWRKMRISGEDVEQLARFAELNQEAAA